jgi:hypothetical protein
VTRRWWIGLVAAWVAGLVALAIWSQFHDPATVRGQSDLATGRATLDRAIDTIVSAAGVTAEVRPAEVTTGCRISVARRGTEVSQTVVFTVPAGREETLLTRLAADLPAAWQASYNPEANRLLADAGDFVAVQGEAAAAGRVEITANTGCRPET